MSLLLISEQHYPCSVYLPAEPLDHFLKIGLYVLTDFQTTLCVSPLWKKMSEGFSTLSSTNAAQHKYTHIHMSVTETVIFKIKIIAHRCDQCGTMAKSTSLGLYTGIIH